MKRTLIILFLVIVMAGSIQARQGTSIAFIAGVPTGMNFKSWISDDMALNVNFGFNILNNNMFMNFDLLPHFELIYNAPFYVGGGLRLEIDGQSKNKDNYMAGFRAVAGQEIFLGSKPVSLFYEVGGVFDVVTKLDLNPTAAIGIRYYLSR